LMRQRLGCGREIVSPRASAIGNRAVSLLIPITPRRVLAALPAKSLS
jgi:hypothetical protein